MVKRFISLVIVLCMTLTMLPSLASAAGGLVFDMKTGTVTIENGTGKNTFSPQASTNRGMIVAILHKLSGSEETLQSPFRDVVSGAYYAEGVAWAQKNGIVAGYGNGLFDQEDSITREHDNHSMEICRISCC